MVSDTVPIGRLPGTTTPVSEEALTTNHFLHWTPDEVREWAKENLEETGLSNTNIVILDRRTNEDHTCFLATEWAFPEAHDDRLLVRSDFESSIVSLMTIEMGCGDESHVSIDYEGSDGILRYKVRDAAEKMYLEQSLAQEPRDPTTTDPFCGFRQQHVAPARASYHDVDPQNVVPRPSATCRSGNTSETFPSGPLGTMSTLR